MWSLLALWLIPAYLLILFWVIKHQQFLHYEGKKLTHKITDTRRRSRVIPRLNKGTVAATKSMWAEEYCLACTAVHLSLKKFEALVFECQKDLAGNGNNGKGLGFKVQLTHYTGSDPLFRFGSPAKRNGRELLASPGPQSIASKRGKWSKRNSSFWE